MSINNIPDLDDPSNSINQLSCIKLKFPVQMVQIEMDFPITTQFPK